MFFDKPLKDTALTELLCELARKQRQILNCHFNWKDREKIVIPQKRTLFRRGKIKDPVYEQMYAELDDLKQQVRRYRQQKGYASGTFWWTIPWEQVEAYLIYDLYRNPPIYGWNFDRKLTFNKMDDGRMLLALQERGHYSSFSGDIVSERSIISKYSGEEIDRKMRNFDHLANLYEIDLLASDDGSKVHSELTGVTYDSATDYVQSMEHYAVREYQRNQLEKSLYTNVETTTIHLNSQSQDYRACYLLGAVEIDSYGKLNRLEVLNYRRQMIEGSMPDEIRDWYTKKDAAVECAAFLADCDSVVRVPEELFGKALEQGTVDFEEAMRQAEIYTCLANKLSV